VRTPSRRTSFLLATAALVATAAGASGHATVSPGTVAPGAQVELVVQSIVERDALINTKMQLVVPRQWQTVSCRAPLTWTCSVDRKAVAPHVLVTYAPVLQATPADIDFAVTVKAPAKADGSYLFRALQTHADGWVEPWVYDKEPYPAPRVQVGSSTRTVNGEGTKEDPRCVGPAKQPKDYGSHDGSAGSCLPGGAKASSPPLLPDARDLRSRLTLAVR
jgi:hypothetical protein